MADSQFDQYPQDLTPFHCREPMSLVAPEAELAGTAQSGQPDQPDGHVPPRVLRCRCGFQMDAPAGG
ncbi:hypothetical protein QFZ65_001942 [Arthrobacter sp. B3I9]|nr:hypothetical protein [Arthrobacter sp. B3I9]